jgi:16S rRNA (guanine966-N2)-methyltransferase
MSALQFELPGARVLDLFAGSGALGLEALSRGADHVTFVERAAPAIAALRENMERLGVTGGARVIRRDVFAFLNALPADGDEDGYDIVLADPPYGVGLAAELLRRFGERPFGAALWVEHGRDEPLPDLPASRTRVYGDTAITTTRADR